LEHLAGVLDRKVYPREMHLYLLDLMRKFELCYEFYGGEGHYLIPELLGKEEPDIEKYEGGSARCERTDALRFEYRYNILPEGLLPRFIVRSRALNKNLPRWRTGLVLAWDGNHAVVKADVQDRRVSIAITGPLAGRRRLLAVIRADMEHIHRSIAKLQATEQVPVPRQAGLVVDYATLLALEAEGEVDLRLVHRGRMVRVKIADLLGLVEESPRRPRILWRPTAVGKGLQVAFSYSHKDEELRDQLETRLKLLQRQGVIKTWHDRKILGSENWAGVIDDNFKRADVILLLVSADFLASDYCFESEMKIALERASKGEARVVPVILRACAWKDTPFGNLQVLPRDGRPVTSWRNRDEAWAEVTAGLRRLVEAPQEPKRNLVIKKLVLRNIRCFPDIALDFSANTNPLKFLLFLGENSVGKTTLLRSIALALCDETAAAALVGNIVGDFLRDLTSEGSIVLYLATPESMKEWRLETKFRRDSGGKVSIQREVPLDFPAHQLFVCGYGAARRNFGTSDYPAYAPQHSLATLFNYETTMQNPELVLRRMLGRSGNLQEITRKIDEVLLLAPGSTTIEQTGISIRGPWGEFSPVGALGDGYQGTLAWIVDLLGWLLLHNEDSLVGEPSGIVLIDEIDQHLHPSWQREIIMQLHRQFPMLQFIATTHAPMCALGMTALGEQTAGLVTLCQSEEGVLAGLAPLPNGKRADEVLTSPLFGLFSASAFGISADLEKFACLKAKKHRTTEDDLELVRLGERLGRTLGPFQSALEKRIHDVVSEALKSELHATLVSGELSSEVLDLKVSEQLKKAMGLPLSR